MFVFVGIIKLILKFKQRGKRAKTADMILKEDQHHSTLRLTVKPQKSRQGGVGKIIHTQLSGSEERVQKYMHLNTVS